MFEFDVRQLTPGDAAAVAALADQLGYEVSAAAVRSWIVGADDSRIALAAVDEDEVVGWIQAHDRHLLQSPRVVEIDGLVVAEHQRGRGIGRLLVDAVAEWGRHRGHTAILVRSNVIRDRAHGFYEDLGFTLAKTSHTFSREIEGG